MDLVKIDAKEYGLEESKASEIKSVFLPMLNKMEDLEKEYNSIAKMDITPETISLARELRLEYVKVRTGTAKIHKESKSHYVKVGKFIDGFKNAQLLAAEGIEQKLMDIEKHYENIEKEKKITRWEERIDLLIEYGCENIPASLIDMEEEVFQNYLFGVKKTFEMKKEAEEKAEQDKIKKQKEDEEEKKRVQEENEKLKKEAAAREKREAADKKERDKNEAARLKKEEAENKKKEIEEKADRIARQKIEEARQKKEDAEREKKELELKKETDKREKAEAELKEKKEKEARLEAEEKAAQEAELKKGDTDKVKDLINDLELMKVKYNFSSNSNKKMFKDTCLLLDKIIIHIKKRM